jgi:hypothetical protein
MPAAEGVRGHNDQTRASILFNSNTPQTHPKSREKNRLNNMHSNHTKKNPSKFFWFIIRFALCFTMGKWVVFPREGRELCLTTASSKTL